MTKKLQECPECGARTGQDDTEAHYLDCAKRCGKQNKLQELIEGFGYLLIRVREDPTLEFEPHVFKHKLMEIAQLAEEGERQRILKEIKHWQKTIQKETGAFKYDFVFQGIYQLLSNQKEDENNPEN